MSADIVLHYFHVIFLSADMLVCVSGVPTSHAILLADVSYSRRCWPTMMGCMVQPLHELVIMNRHVVSVIAPKTVRSGNVHVAVLAIRGCNSWKSTQDSDAAWDTASDLVVWRAQPPIAGQVVQ